MLQVQLEIGADPKEVGRARNWARSRLAGCGINADEPLTETLLLLISELVTNAVVHTGAPAVLRMLLPGRHVSGAVRVEVTDTSSRPPRQRRADGEDTNGRGLELVSGLADRWGWQHEGTGKRIWCELDRAGDGQGCCVFGTVGSEDAAGSASLAGPGGPAGSESAPVHAGPAVQLTAGVGRGGADPAGGARVRPGAFRVREGA